MNWIKENQLKIGIALAILLMAGFTINYRGSQTAAVIDTQNGGEVLSELEECLANVQRKVDEVTIELNEWFSDPESEKYDNSGVWDDVAVLATKDREKCHAEFGN